MRFTCRLEVGTVSVHGRAKTSEITIHEVGATSRGMLLETSLRKAFFTMRA